MRAASEEDRAKLDPTWWSSMRTMGFAAVKLYRARLELLLLDLEEAKERFERRLLLWLVAGVLLLVGLQILTAFFIWLLVPTLGVWALGLFALLYLGGGGAICGRLYQRSKCRHRTFASTLEEFEKDGECFAEMLENEEKTRFDSAGDSL
jgi:uncharacterized membrane protein YqjE